MYIRLCVDFTAIAAPCENLCELYALSARPLLPQHVEMHETCQKLLVLARPNPVDPEPSDLDAPFRPSTSLIARAAPFCTPGGA